MNNFLHSKLDSASATIVCCTLSFVNKCVIAWLYTDVSSDKALYFLFAKTIMNGNAPLEDTGAVNDVTNYFFNGAITSPLYSILAVPFLWLTGSPTLSSFIIDVLAWSIFFTGLYKLGRKLLKETWVINLLIITVGFFLYPHELYSTPKDTISLGLLCWACVLCLDIIVKPFKPWRSTIFFIVLAAIALTKFFYAPVAFAFIIFICFYSIAKKREALFTQSIFIGLVLTLSAILFYQYLTYLQNLYKEIAVIPLAETDNKKGFYPENLFYVFPFISSSIVNTIFWTAQLSKALNQNFAEIEKWWRLVDCLLLVFLIFQAKNGLNKWHKNIGWLICGFISLVIFLLICYVSLTRQSSIEELYLRRFIFLGEPRFYLFIMFIFQVSLFYLVFKFPAKPFLKTLFLPLFFFEILHGFYFTAKQSLHYISIQKESTMVNPVVNVFESILKPIKKSRESVVFISSNQDLRRLAQINDTRVLFFSRTSYLQKERSNGLIIVAHAIKDSTLFNKNSFLKEIKSDTIKPFIIKTYR